MPALLGTRIPMASLVQAMAVAEHRSFTHAAAALGITQSSVSMRVRALEDELGLLLFERRPRGVRLTDAGRRFINEIAAGIGQLDYAMSKLPKRSDIAEAQPIEITIDVPTVVAEEVARLTQACDDGDLSMIIAKYPVRETPALREIAIKLGFQGRTQYENSVRKMLMDDPEALVELQALFGTLKSDIDAA